MGEPLYKIGPGDGQWISFSEVLQILNGWNSMPSGTGVPSLTISKDTREPAPAAVVELGNG